MSQIPIDVTSNLGVGDVSWSPDGTKIPFIMGVHLRAWVATLQHGRLLFFPHSIALESFSLKG